jgi:hypothetical protein
MTAEDRPVSEQPAAHEDGVIHGVALLDLTSHTADALSRIRRISAVALVLVPESLAGALAGIAMDGVATVLPVPDGARVKVHTGVMTADGGALANPGGDRDVLVVTGVMILTSPVEHVGYHTVMVTGVVLAPRGSEVALGAGLTRLTGVSAYYDYSPGQAVKVFQGQTKVRGEALANSAGQPSDVAIVAGQLVVTSQVARLGFQSLVVAGQLAAPLESQELLEPALTVVGQVVWYSGRAVAFSGKDRFSRGFFELIEGPVTLLLSGSFELDPDVPAELLREKVAGIALSGTLKGARNLVPVLQLLTTEKHGVIRALDEDG